MNVEEIKHRIATLSLSEQGEVWACLFHLRHASDPEYQERISSRLADHDPANRVTPGESERRSAQGKCSADDSSASRLPKNCSRTANFFQDAESESVSPCGPTSRRRYISRTAAQ